ncbi:hypothetical protein CMV_012738 [Castanea mollissima]|uniref:C-JID domain-containing protein n=1 Tax=Castanea mollissima TaxID=60419 RepID=A0A8J4VMN0_9ROSI|nr:hypothetical protein CMV_012738 [Castanea mollissima]
MIVLHFQDLCYNDVSKTNRFDLVAPGRKFPKWFSYQSAGASVTVQVPPNFENCLAIGLCAAFEYLPSGLCGLFGRGRHMLVCSITFYPNGGLDSSTALKEGVSFALPEKMGQVIRSHVWLIYLRREYFPKFIPMFHRTLEIKFDLQIDFNTEGTGYLYSNVLHKFRESQLHSLNDYETEGTSYVHSNGLHEIEENGFDCQTEYKTEGTGFKINKCGVHFVFKQDIEDLSQTNEMDFFSDGEGSFSDEAGPSGEGSFSDEPGHSGEGSSKVMTSTEWICNLNQIGSLMLRLGNWFRDLWR